MKYIAIDPENFSVTVTDKPSKSALVVPSQFDSRGIFSPNQPKLGSVVYFNVLYPSVWREDRRKGVENVSYCLVQPDPWLIALAAIMWEGIVQGLSYDLIKTYFLNGLQTLRNAGLAPAKTDSDRQVSSKTQIRFHWTSYGKDGNKRRELYFDLKRAYESMHEREKLEVNETLKPQLRERKKVKK